MSRTLKDRPYWVKTNDNALPLTEHHDHTHAGEPIMMSLPVKDEAGNLMYETVIRENVLLNYTFRDYYGVTSVFTTRTAALAYIERSPWTNFEVDFYAVYGNKEVQQVKCAMTLVGYRPDECTIDKPRNGIYPWRSKNMAEYLCWKEVDVRLNGGCPCCRHRPIKEQRRSFHASARRTEAIALHKLRGIANFDDEMLDHIDYENEVTTRQQRHMNYR